MYYIYVLKSLKNGRYYTGSTNNLDRRLQEHTTGRSTYTSLTRPFRLVYTERFSTNIEARQRERYLKTGRGRQELQHLISNSLDERE